MSKEITPKERFLRAVKKEEVDRVPVVAICKAFL